MNSEEQDSPEAVEPPASPPADIEVPPPPPYQPDDDLITELEKGLDPDSMPGEPTEQR